MPEVNQNIAGKIKATTGVERITEIGNLRKSFTKEYFAEAIPRSKPLNTEIAEEISTLKKVKRKSSQKEAVRISFKISENTASGDGRIRGAPIR